MNKKNLSLILVVVGVFIYFFPIIQQVTGDGQNQSAGALFAIGGLILWYLPGSAKK